MCKFLSAIVFQNGRIYKNSATDSHEDLIAELGLDDSAPVETRTWVRVEFSPEDTKDYCNLEKFVLTVDESSTPIWFEDRRENIQSELRSFVETLFVSGKKRCIVGGEWI